MAAVAPGSGASREEEGTGGDAATPQPPAPTSVPGARLSRLPLARVKALVKADPDVTLAGQEAIFILARAAELFVETIAKDAYCCAQQGKRKTLQRRDLDNAIEAVDEFAFLEDIVAGKGDNGESIYGPTFEDENFSVLHNKRGVLGMVNKGRHSNGSQFYITLQAAPYLDKKYVAFGYVHFKFVYVIFIYVKMWFKNIGVSIIHSL
uniref:Peptidylprolyl isomerase like 6 n=1 Tax=Ovis aries TaxID=9940 RepID=A0AC11EH29_SHEEP